MTPKKPAARQPWHPARWSDADAHAVKALARGEAEPHQQKRALAWIIDNAAMLGEQSFIPDDPGGRTTAFIEGRRSVGNQILKLIKVNLENKNG